MHNPNYFGDDTRCYLFQKYDYKFLLDSSYRIDVCSNDLRTEQPRPQCELKADKLQLLNKLILCGNHSKTQIRNQ